MIIETYRIIRFLQHPVTHSSFTNNILTVIFHPAHKCYKTFGVSLSIPSPVFVSERACGTNYVITQRKENIRLIRTLQTAENNKNKRITYCWWLLLLVSCLDYHNISAVYSIFSIVMKDGAKQITKYVNQTLTFTNIKHLL